MSAFHFFVDRPALFLFHLIFVFIVLVVVISLFRLLNIAHWFSSKWMWRNEGNDNDCACLSVINEQIVCRRTFNDNNRWMSIERQCRCWRELKYTCMHWILFSSVEMWFLPFLVVPLDFHVQLQVSIATKRTSKRTHSSFPIRDVEAEQCIFFKLVY